MQELLNNFFFKIQALLIYELENKNNLKNINDQNFTYFMRVTTKASSVKQFSSSEIKSNSVDMLSNWK